MRAVILAGGSGTRLRPQTATRPKPLLPLGGELPVLDVALRRMAHAGVRRVTLAVSHLHELVMAHASDGARWGLAIDYVIDERPLGTAGPLAMIRDLPETFVVMNGDVLSDLDPRVLLAAHAAAGNDVTVAVSRMRTVLDVGVVRYDADGRLRELVEKPILEHDINMGIYAVSRAMVERLPRAEPAGFDRMLRDGLVRGDRIGVLPHAGIWLDIGTPDSYRRANASWGELRGRLLP